MKIPRAECNRSASRTLDSLRADHDHYYLEGLGDLSKAKFYNNVIGTNIFDIPGEIILES